MRRSFATLALAVLAGCSSPALPPEATEDIRIPPLRHATVSDIKEGESACSYIFFTTDGTPMLLLGQEEELVGCPYGDRIWLKNGRFLGRLNGPPSTARYTGYSYLPFGSVRVWLVERP